ncbi:MAG: UxaA family hydrolase [Desulfobacterales bacterium]|nr:UxaA family hydrolase [Desulfobacterales bacterium]
MASQLIFVDDKDNVAVALRDFKKGEALQWPGGPALVAFTDIPCGHKVAIKDLAAQAPIVKYGEVIGRAKEAIRPGQWVHTHNLMPVEKE